MLEDRGINAEFMDELLEFSTTFEHKQYIGFLEQLREFAKKWGILPCVQCPSTLLCRSAHISEHCIFLYVSFGKCVQSGLMLP